MDMDLYDFFMLNESEQTETLVQSGQLVAMKYNAITYLSLFSVSTFYVEFEWEKFTNRMVGKQIFKSGAELDKYLPDIDLVI